MLTENPAKLEETRCFGKSLFFRAYDSNCLDVARDLLDPGLDPEGAGITSLLNGAKASGRRERLELFESFQSVSGLYSERVDTSWPTRTVDSST